MYAHVQVEGEELEVLKGLDAADWGRVHQVALEVHDCIDTGAAHRTHQTHTHHRTTL
jgi:hypothetical protein